jgi:hypothetical protein
MRPCDHCNLIQSFVFILFWTVIFLIIGREEGNPFPGPPFGFLSSREGGGVVKDVVYREIRQTLNELA